MNQEMTTAQDIHGLATEVGCLKMLLGCMLKSMSQVDAGKAILRMEGQLNLLAESEEKALSKQTMQQIKDIYLGR